MGGASCQAWDILSGRCLPSPRWSVVRRLEVTVWEASLEVALKAEGMDEKGPG